MKMFQALLVAACALPAALPAQSRRPMTFADLMAVKRVGDPQISPSGKWVLYSVTDVSLPGNTRINHLWVVPLAGGAEHQVTFGDGEANGRFSPDGNYISIEQKGQIYLAGWDEKLGRPGPARQLTTVSTEAAGAVWSPDSSRLLFTSTVYPDCSNLPDWPQQDSCNARKDKEADNSPVKARIFTSLLFRHWNSYTGLKRSHIFAVSVSTGGRDVRDLTPASVVGDAETPTFSLGGPAGYTWAPGSHEIAYVTNLDPVKASSTNNDIFTLQLDEPGARAVKVSTSLGSDDGPQYSPDGKYLAFRSQERAGYESDRFRLMLYDRTSLSLEEMTPDFDGWIDEFAWTEAEAPTIVFTSAVRGEEWLFEAVAQGPVNLLRRGAEYGSPVVLPTTPHGGNILVTKMKVDAPAELVKIGLSDAGKGRSTEGVLDTPAALHLQRESKSEEIQLTHQNGKLLASLQLAPLQSFDFEGAEGAKVQGFLIKPPNFNPSTKYPVKFLIHGGPQGAWGDVWSYRWNAELMAATGYVVVMINPRGSTGYGQKFVEGVSGDWGGKPYVDLMRGLDAAEARFPFLDKSRECALGASYGGYMADWILTQTDRFQCIVTHDGMYNPVSAYGTTEELWFNEWEFRRAEDFPSPGNPGKPAQPWRYAGLPEGQDPFRKFSPELHIQNAKTPTLVIHGQRDYRLDVSEGLQLFTDLQRLGVPSKMLYFPDEGHWVLKPQNSELWNKTISDWCDQYTHTNTYATTK